MRGYIYSLPKWPNFEWDSERFLPLVSELRSMQGKLIGKMEALGFNQLLDEFKGKLTNSKYAKINKCSSDTALRDIQDLVKKAILKKEVGGGRSTNYKMKAY